MADINWPLTLKVGSKVEREEVYPDSTEKKKIISFLFISPHS